MIFALLASLAHATCVEAELPLAFEPQAGLADTEPPDVPELVDIGFNVVWGDGCEGCGDALRIRAVLGDTQDDTTSPESMGYQIRVLDGALPGEIVLPEGPVQGPELVFVFPIEPETLEEDLAVQLELRAVDQAGNVSTRSLVVDVRAEGGKRPFTCSQSGGSGTIAGLGLLIWALRRKNRETHPGSCR